MKNKKYFMIAALFMMALMMGRSLLAENITLTTYYPAPFGAYDRIKLVPRDPLAAEEHCAQDKDVGTIYFSKGGEAQLPGIYVCQKFGDKDFNWVFMSRSFYGSEGPVTNQKVVCVNPDGGFGVCLNNPSFDGTCACN